MVNLYLESIALYFITEMKEPPLLVDILFPKLLLFYYYAFDTSNSNWFWFSYFSNTTDSLDSFFFFMGSNFFIPSFWKVVCFIYCGTGTYYVQKLPNKLSFLSYFAKTEPYCSLSSCGNFCFCTWSNSSSKPNPHLPKGLVKAFWTFGYISKGFGDEDSIFLVLGLFWSSLFSCSLLLPPNPPLQKLKLSTITGSYYSISYM